MSRSAFEDLLLAQHRNAVDVAKTAGVSKGTIGGLLANEHGAALPTVRAIARAMRCQPATLFPALIGTPAERLPKEPDLPVADDDEAA